MTNAPMCGGGVRKTSIQAAERSAATVAQQPTARTIGVVILDLTEHINHGFLSPDVRRMGLPLDHYPPGTNIELHIGRAGDVLPGTPGMWELGRALSGCTVVIKGTDIKGIHAVQAAIDRLRGLPAAPERHGCQNGMCELLYGPEYGETA